MSRNPTEPSPIGEEKPGHRGKEEGQEGRRRGYRGRRSRERRRSRKKRSKTEERETKRISWREPQVGGLERPERVRPRRGN
ncbi:hypothetical protein NDU88_000726 [Pleurodeles waltl]|uniref:Uncharacterized protein n=1 Tax=Pleurodeles waltl TaxID=8319 RepID=A0AAV7TGA1_PLEWA|nr:hypothetical protein NDU88_000726 [Pleurodeles waltl]